jgi:hypothetical protein
VPAPEIRLADLRLRAEQLRRKGLSSVEIDRAVGVDLILAECDVRCAKSGLKTLEADIELLDLELQASKGRLEAASRAYDLAGQRLLLATALADSAASEGQSAEARALAAQKEEFEAALGGVGVQASSK